MNHVSAEAPIKNCSSLTNQSQQDSPLNRPQQPKIPPRCVQQWFEEQVGRSPDAVAVIFAEESLTYQQLNTRANQLAHYLRARQVGPDSLVAIHAERSAEFIVAVLGVLKAGGAYLPLDSECPAERLRSILADAEVAVLICSGHAAVDLESPGRLMLQLQTEAAQISAASQLNPVRVNTPEHLAYVIYTSGSTGRPKGVCMPHGPLFNLIQWQLAHSPIGVGHRTLQFASFGFDVCFQEIFSTLSAGGTLVMAPAKARKDFACLVRLIEQREIQRLFLPFMALELLAMVVTSTGRRLPAVREVITAGEQLRITPAIRSLFQGLTGVRLVNQYGPTEAHVVSAFELAGDPTDWPFLPPIGRAIANTQLYILNPDRQPVPTQIIGELYIGGAGVAQGYLKRPELTAEKFTPDPFIANPGGRLYRTGDLARYLPDGSIEFLGRSDDQVKIRGFRVELGEIEALLATHVDVQSVVVMARADDPGDKLLAAYVIGRKKEAAQLVPELRNFLQPQLPDYMVPAVFIVLPAFPLTPNGKIDRQALPAPNPGNFNSGVDYVPPRTPDEQKIADLWCMLLGLPKIGVHDNFFHLGGDSLMVVKLMLEVEKLFGQWLELSTFRVQPTVAGLCKAIRSRQSQTTIEPVLTIRKSGTRPPLFCLYGITGDVDEYFNLAAALGDDQPVIGIRSPALKDLSRLPQSLEAAATEVVRWIRTVQPQGAPALVGYSWAGLLAFEVAAQLAQADGVGCFTALIGPDTPVRQTTLASRITHFVRYFPPWLWGLVRDHLDFTCRLRRWWEMAHGTRQNPVVAHLTPPEWATSPISRHLIGLIAPYRPQPTGKMSVNLFREYDGYESQAHPFQPWRTNHLPDRGWHLWTRSATRIHWLPGDHLTILKPPIVASLAQAIRSAMDQHSQSLAGSQPADSPQPHPDT